MFWHGLQSQVENVTQYIWSNCNSISSSQLVIWIHFLIPVIFFFTYVFSFQCIYSSKGSPDAVKQVFFGPSFEVVMLSMSLSVPQKEFCEACSAK